jgi:hypothetical protein
MRSSLKRVEVGTTVLEAVQVILNIWGSTWDEGFAGTATGGVSDVEGDCNGTSVAWTPFSILPERLHFSDKGAAWINRASIL